ncbi:MAG: fimbrillin family protein [Alistipes sp.]|nr:fimbrillin family protein [Alistipes sp.]
MKKILFFGLALAAFASCSKDQVVETPQGAAIGFGNVFVENATRVDKDLTMDNLANFGVYGSVAKGSDNALIFNNQEVAKNGDAFTYSPAQYWIADAAYTFAAFAPYQDGDAATWTYATSLAQNGTLTFHNDLAKAEQDLLYAYATRETGAIREQPAAVGLTFGHLLSKVAFKFTNAFVDNNISLEVKNVTISNTAKTGTMTIADGVDGAWVDGNDDLKVEFGATEDTELSNGEVSSTAHFYLIPVEREYLITFDVVLYQAGVELDTYEHEIKTTISLEKGRSYSLNATLAPENVNPDQQLYPIEFTVDAVEEWVNNVVALTTVEVATAAELTAALAAGQNVTLTATITLESGLALTKDAVVALNGQTLTYAGDDVLFRVNSGVVTIDGTAADSAINTNPTTPGAGGNGYVALVKGGATLNINGGVYNAAATCTIAQVSEGTLNINGGTFQVNMDKYTDANGEARYLLNCSDTPYNNGTAVINVYGGSFYKFNPGNNAAEGAGTNFLAEGKTATADGNWYNVQ